MFEEIDVNKTKECLQVYYLQLLFPCSGKFQIPGESMCLL